MKSELIEQLLREPVSVEAYHEMYRTFEENLIALLSD